MEVYEIVKNTDGTVEVKTILTAEEMKFMMEFALANLMALGFAPNSVAAYIEANKDEIEKQQQQELLMKIPEGNMGNA